MKLRSASAAIGAIATVGVVVASIALASAPRVSITSVRAPVLVLARNLRPHAAETHTKVAIDATLKGKLPAGAKVRLSTRAYSLAPYRLAKGAITFHNGHAVVDVTAATASTVTYRLVVVSAHGATLAKSGAVAVFWIAPPTGITVTDDGDQATVTIKTGALYCPGKNTASGTVCANGDGQQSLGSEPTSVYADILDIPPGSHVSLYFNKKLVCTANWVEESTSNVNPICQDVQTVMPENTSPTVIPLIPATATYTSPTGKTTSVTLEIPDYGNPSS